ncbi:MAG: RHS repeat-associated core domain-containing protein, partial [Candidatus Omnitrophica bacterium]|nr:RHS repeat-associated core domain-containing protein [Candidatus Omnitrophota bacterium]
GIGGMISQARAGVTTWFHNIHNGPTNVSHLTNSTGAVVQKYAFDAFGNLTLQTGSTTNNYRFQTKELHPTSGLVYFGARWYNPTIGRWMSPDPLGIIDGPNVYCYLSNNPINDIDPWGLCGSAGGGGVKSNKEKDEPKKKKQWAPWFFQLFIPGYGNYGGPFRTDLSFNAKPKDSMDRLFMQHDRDWGEKSEANKDLYNQLKNLPANPNRWSEKPNNVVRAAVYRELSKDYFWFVSTVEERSKNEK